MNDNSIRFDETAAGILNGNGELTVEGDRLLDEHYARINTALQEWANSRFGVIVEFTDSVAVTALGRTAHRGGTDYLPASPEAWVAEAHDALTEIVREAQDAIAETGWDVRP